MDVGEFCSSNMKIFSMISFIILLNMITMYSCILMGCYEFTFSNIFRLDLVCNTCVDITYTIYKYQKDAYIMIGGMIFKSFADYILGSKKLE